MFAVFGVCKKHCLARAKKLTKDWKEVEGGGRELLSETEWEAAVAATADDLYAKAKPRKISSLFEAKSAAEAFKELAAKTREARAVSIKRRDHLRRDGKIVLNAKTKKPRFAWVAA